MFFSLDSNRCDGCVEGESKLPTRPLRKDDLKTNERRRNLSSRDFSFLFLLFLLCPPLPAFPILSLLQKTYHPLLSILAVNSEHIFHQASRGPPPDESTTREIVKDFLKERSDDTVGGLGFGVFEDREGVVTDGESFFIFTRFVDSRRVQLKSQLPRR